MYKAIYIYASVSSWSCRECRGSQSPASQAGSLLWLWLALQSALLCQSCDPTMVIFEEWLSKPPCQVLSILPSRTVDTFGVIV